MQERTCPLLQDTLILTVSGTRLRIAGRDAGPVFLIIGHIGVGIWVVYPIIASIRLQLRPVIFNIAATHSQ